MQHEITKVVLFWKQNSQNHYFTNNYYAMMHSENAEVKIIRFTFVINLSVNRTYHSIIETILSHYNYLMLLLAVSYKNLLQTF